MKVRPTFHDPDFVPNRLLPSITTRTWGLVRLRNHHSVYVGVSYAGLLSGTTRKDGSSNVRVRRNLPKADKLSDPVKKRSVHIQNRPPINFHVKEPSNVNVEIYLTFNLLSEIRVV